MKLLKDVKSSISEGSDFLGQYPSLQTLLGAVKNIPPPACLALYGSWGSGKTALMHSAYESLNDEDSPHRAVWFDPWAYERHQNVLAMLIAQIIQQLALDPKTTKKLKDQAERLLKPVLTLTGRMIPAIVALSLGDPTAAAAVGLSGLAPDKLAEQLTQKDPKIDEVAQIREAFAALVEQALGTPAKQTEATDPNAKATSRLVIFLDDLDRCLPDQAVWLIEAVKLMLADSQGTSRAVFVFGLDRQIIGEAIRSRFPQSTLYTGENYLEKIFDLSLEAPQISLDTQKLEAFIRHVGGGEVFQEVPEPHENSTHTESNKSQSKENQTVFGLLPKHDVLEILSQPAFANPRVIKRVINRLCLLSQAHKGSMPMRTLDAQKAAAWIAGTERFRTFRNFFSGASKDEQRALDLAVRATYSTQASAAASTWTIKSLVNTPGFVSYYRELLQLGQSEAIGKDLERERTPSKTEQIATLQDLDLWMRKVGL